MGTGPPPPPPPPDLLAVDACATGALELAEVLELEVRALEPEVVCLEVPAVDLLILAVDGRVDGT